MDHDRRVELHAALTQYASDCSSAAAFLDAALQAWNDERYEDTAEALQQGKSFWRGVESRPLRGLRRYIAGFVIASQMVIYLVWLWYIFQYHGANGILAALAGAVFSTILTDIVLAIAGAGIYLSGKLLTK